MSGAGRFEISVDIGGTFTDVVCRDLEGGVRLVKIPTTRNDPSAGVRGAMRYMRKEWNVNADVIQRFVHGTTVATNAVLERKGACVGLLTTAGFRDVLEIGRQMRHAVYDIALKPETPVFLAPGAFRKEVRERITATGEVHVPLDEDSVKHAVDSLVENGAQAIAVCFLFSFLNPAHEHRTREIIAERYPDLMVSLSSDIDPSFREYERTCVTAFDAYIKPVVDRYLINIEGDLTAAAVVAPFQIMQSRGGISSSRIARRRPVRLFLSGPAAGVVGGLEVGRQVGIEDLITVDIGGTSCDIALIARGEPLIRPEGEIGGYSVRVPMIDVNAIGSGGGSIAWIDSAGSLRIGPESAGSEPGPACYDRGGQEATVTDASVILGYINPNYFANGMLKLVPARALSVIESKIARPLGMTPEQAALGIHRVVNAQMAEAIRLVSIGRGIDPRSYTLLPLGGGGALHATALARELGIRRIVVPRHPGVLSSAGLLFAPVEHEVSAAFPRPLDASVWTDARRTLDQLDATCCELMRSEGVSPQATQIIYQADVCYIGQSYHLEIPLVANGYDPLARLYRDFVAAHNRIYGHSTEAPARIVNLRTIHRSTVSDRVSDQPYQATRTEPNKGPRRILTGDGRAVSAMVYDRPALSPGAEIVGPAIIEQPDTTTLVEPGWRGTVTANGTLLITCD